MFKRIIVPLDGTYFAETALAPARELARVFDARLLLMRAVAPPPAPQGQVETDQQVKVERLDDADAYLHEQVSALRSQGFAADMLVYAAEPDAGLAPVLAPVLARLAAFDAADLIVMTAHTRWIVGPIDTHSMTLRLLDRSPVPVLVWHKPSQRWEEPLHVDASHASLARSAGPLIVPLDGSSFAEQALPTAEALARRFACPVVLVRAVARASDPLRDLHAAGGDASDRATVAYLTRMHQAREYVRRIQDTLERRGIHTLTAVRTGTPFAAIEGIAREHRPRLLVMASHSYGETMKRLLHSVTAQVVEELEVPVLVLRPEASHRDAGARRHVLPAPHTAEMGR